MAADDRDDGMAESENCPRCGGDVPTDSPWGSCPKCLLANLLGGGEDREGYLIAGIELGRLLGQGAFGEVFEGIQVEAGLRRVAVKILGDGQLTSARKNRFVEESRLLALLEHPHLSRLLDSGITSDGRPYYTMELVDGPAFDTWCREAGPDERLEVLCQLAEAVAHAHTRSIVHRDLKPGNILIQTSGDQPSARIIDFGIARALEGTESWARDATLEGQRLGTPLYMAPEQLAGEPGIDLRTDVFALGLLIYESELGRPVLDGVVNSEKSWQALLDDLRGFVFPRLPRRELDWIARRACALDPADRYPGADALARDLRNLQAGRPVAAGSSHAGYRFRKFLSLHRTAILTGSAAVAGLVLFAVTNWRSAVRERDSRQRIERAGSELRRQSSDAALLAASRAMDMENPAEALHQLDRALQLWPDNREATYARNFLKATIPTARLATEWNLPAPAEPAGLTEDGDFGLRTADGLLLVGKHGETRAVELDHQLRPDDGPDVDDEVEVIDEPGGTMRFLDRKTGALALAPLVYGSGREKALYSARRGEVLVTSPDGGAALWDVSAMGRAYEEAVFSPPIAWMGFERESNDLWTIDANRMSREWREGKKPGFPLPFPFLKKDHLDRNVWLLGEGHTRGLSDGKQALAGIIYLAQWNLQEGGVLNSFVQARDRDCHLAGGESRTTRLAFQNDETPFKAIEGSQGVPLLLAIDADGRLGLCANDRDELEVLDLAGLRVSHRFPAPGEVVSLTILDGARDLVVACADGSVRVYGPEGQATGGPFFPCGKSGPFGGLNVRAVPGKREFMLRLQDDLNLRRFAAPSGKESAPPLRHREGIEWICPSAKGDFLFSIDQGPQSATGTLRIWSLRTHQEIAPPLVHPARILFATVIDDGRRVATSDANGSLRRWVFGE